MAQLLDGHRRARAWSAGIWWALTLLSHLFLGMLVAVAAAAYLAIDRRAVLARLRRFAGAAAIAAVLASFSLIPMMASVHYQGGMPVATPQLTGPGVGAALLQLVDGTLLDEGRTPLITAAAGVGLIVVCLRRRERLARWLLLLGALSFAGYLGRRSFGSLYTALPFHANLEAYRYVDGLQLTGLALAALGTEWLVVRFAAQLRHPSQRRWLAVAALVAGVLLLAGRGVTTRRRFRVWDERQGSFAAVVDALARDRNSRYAVLSDGRPISHRYLNWLAHQADRPQLVSYSRGYHDTLSTYYLLWFEPRPELMRLYNVGALLGLTPQPPPPGTHLSWHDDHHWLFVVDRPSRNFEFVTTPVEIVGDAKAIRPIVEAWLEPLFRYSALPLLRDGGAPPSTGAQQSGDELRFYVEGRRVFAGSPQQFLGQVGERLPWSAPRARVIADAASRNRYDATVDVDSAGERLLLKASFHPNWQAFVDGDQTPIMRVAPNLMAIDVGTGRHQVSFRYRNPLYQKLLALLSLACFLVGTVQLVRRHRPR
jgi:hypothetical protein